MLYRVGLFLVFLSAVSLAQITDIDFLRVSTGAANETWNTFTPKQTWHIVNQRGEKVFLRGTNAGGWLVHEPWMTALDANAALDQITMMRRLGERFGADKRDELIAVYEDNFWTETDFDNCAAMGMSVIRLPFTWMNLCTFESINDNVQNAQLRENAFARIDWFLENAGRRGMYVVLDMHGAFGSQNGMDHSGHINDGWQLYNNPNNRRKTVWLWGEIAKRYARNGDRGDLAPVVAMYDILNEPGPKAALINSVQWDFFDEIYKEIRKHDPDHIICMESCWNAAELPNPSRYGWTNVVYQYHYYAWGDAVTNAQMQIDFNNSKVGDIHRANHGVPTYVGEFTLFNLPTAWEYVLNLYNENDWHWTTWTYKVKGNSSWGIFNHNVQNVNVNNDSETTIRNKWTNVRTEQGWANNTIRNAVTNALPGTVGGRNPFNTANLALNKPIVASSHETHATLGDFVASNANDGSLSSRWGSQHADNQWIRVDLETPALINGIRLHHNFAAARAYTVEISEDNTTWQTVFTQNSGGEGVENIPLNPARYARYVRMSASTRVTQWGVSLNEFEVYGSQVEAIAVPSVFSSHRYTVKSPEIRDNNDANGRYVGNLVNNSYLEYYLNVPAAGNYTVRLETATVLPAGQSRNIRISEVATDNILGTIPVAGTATWFSWQNSEVTVALAAGPVALRFVANGAVNIKDITVSSLGAGDYWHTFNAPQNGWTYTGGAQTLSAIAVGRGANALLAGDFNVNYVNNTNAGRATAQIRGIGEHAALNIDVPFDIAKADLLITLEPQMFSIDVGDALPDFAANVAVQGFVGGESEATISFDRAKVSVHLAGVEEDEELVDGVYRLQILYDGDLTLDNYNVNYNDATLFLIVGQPPISTSIAPRRNFVKDGKQGIIISANPVTGKTADFEIRTLENAVVSVSVFDNAGNLVFAKKDVRTQNNVADISWDLTNSAGRFVANGAYLVIGESRGESGKIYRYSAKLGVSRR